MQARRLGYGSKSPPGLVASSPPRATAAAVPRQPASAGENCVRVARIAWINCASWCWRAIALTYHDGEKRTASLLPTSARDGIEPNVDYRVTDDGEFVEAQG